MRRLNAFGTRAVGDKRLSLCTLITPRTKGSDGGVLMYKSTSLAGVFPAKLRPAAVSAPATPPAPPQGVRLSNEVTGI